MDVARDFFMLIGGTVIFLTIIAGIMAFFLFSSEVVVRKRDAREVAAEALSRIEKPSAVLLIAGTVLSLIFFRTDMVAVIGVVAFCYLLLVYGRSLARRIGD